MANRVGYNQQGSVKNYDCLRTVTLWAGGLGVIQSICWIGLTITGIISYTCNIDASSVLSYGSLMRTVFLDLYFTGNCRPAIYQQYDDSVLKSVNTVLDPTQLLVWECVYLGCAVCWLLISTLMLTHVRKDNAKMTAGVIFTWVFFAFTIWAQDLALGVIFGIDYGRFQDKAYNANYTSANVGAVTANNAQLLAGGVAAISLMIIAFKGFVLWIINVGLTVYLVVRALSITSDNDSNDTLFIPRKDSDDILTTRPPIQAYEEQKEITVYTNEAFVPDNRSLGTIELNSDALSRAARMSTDQSLQDRRFRNLDAFQQYPPPRTNNNSSMGTAASPRVQETIVAANITVTPFPAPDYSPPMSRANQGQSQNGILRNQQRYQ